MLEEILAIPVRAEEFLILKTDFKLPLCVPYLGMGSSYFAPLAFKYMGVPIEPELASEYEAYLAKEKKPLGVILSQSGKSSEALWCGKLFDQYIAVTNDSQSPLASAENVLEIMEMLAGEELYSSSKTYINTLLALFCGFGFDPLPSVKLLKQNMEHYAQLGKKMAEDVFKILQSEKVHGIYIPGSGPNIATAMQAALIMSETTKLNFNGTPMAQYDHGLKETAANSIVIAITAPGKSYKRSIDLTKKIAASGAHVFTVQAIETDEHFSVIHNIVPFNFMAFYLSQHLNVQETFVVGGKVTEVNG